MKILWGLLWQIVDFSANIVISLIFIMIDGSVLNLISRNKMKNKKV
jgi:hypothetical protein